jgi:RimJ/RimL family protein N-acetyltransferase
MSFFNNYTPPTPAKPDLSSMLDPAVPFDVNFVYDVKELQNERIRLVPFVVCGSNPQVVAPLTLPQYQPATFARDFLELVKPAPELFKYLPMGPFEDMDDLLRFLHTVGHSNPGWIVFAILDRTKPIDHNRWGDGQLAGAIALLNTEVHNFCTEIGFVMIGKQFQRTHVTTNAVGLLLQWCFDELGLRRVQWQANYRNEPSVQTAIKMGFKHEGIIRWQRMLPAIKKDVGEPVDRNGKEEVGRHSAMLGFYWDEWEAGQDTLVRTRMARTA